MSALTMVEDLIKELKIIFKDYRLKDKNGLDSAINFYAQDVPRNIGESPYSKTPFQIVELTSGTISEKASYTVRAGIIMCVWCKDDEQKGYVDIMNQINKIIERFCKKSTFGAYEVALPIEWQLQSESTFPYFVGGITLSVKCPTIEREDELI